MNQTLVTVLSGYGGKAPAAILVQACGLRLLLDAGGPLYPGQVCDWYQGLEVDAILVTHDHQDHIGSLSKLPEHIPVYATASTARSLPAGRIWRELPTRGTTYIGDIAVRTGLSGHALGGVWLHLDVGGGLFYSGDFSCESLLFPFDLPPPAYLALLDASYGLYDQSHHVAWSILESLLESHPALLPVPPSGRAIEIALWRQQQGFEDWSMDASCYENLTRMISQSSDLLLPGVQQSLRELMPRAATFDPQAHLLLAGEPDGCQGKAGELIREHQARVAEPNAESGERLLIHTGYVAPHAPRGTHTLCWNVHPRLTDLRWLVDMVQPRYCMPLFTQMHDLPTWRNVMGPALSLEGHWELPATSVGVV